MKKPPFLCIGIAYVCLTCGLMLGVGATTGKWDLPIVVLSTMIPAFVFGYCAKTDNYQPLTAETLDLIAGIVWTEVNKKHKDLAKEP